mmetsp:Transcript_13758/g.15417  ORF Transcript_13758/g.15417 Transcript_13758/m.15417 type:complete len:147 (-) Transcript_13758:61-501(-)|eukprot:CAMPEP_0205800008 /NCGR_PEP_ID=MMETSP0205-20121125/1509_1 /ASSEMBLY_ACC=CAM_ASM_000278 /TAXON_ID=36767 /ORGANISM="Euplotes focardii, Strain TN1" /LENGTH=146 /DNA_ID=CAMNT_0053062351 /DNA_START=14 /DNA_END=454 /DNA_ORIENTATION=+
MKFLLLVLLISISAVFAESDQILHPKNSDEILDHLEGNNYNIYILFFAETSPYKEVATRNNKEIEDGLKSILTDNPELFFATIDHTNPNFQKLLQVTGVYHAPSVFVMAHGEGVWIYEGSSELILERLRDFLPQFKEASSHQSTIY